MSDDIHVKALREMHRYDLYELQLKAASKEIDTLRTRLAAAEKVVEASWRMIKGGHYDTCGFVLDGSSECSCGAFQLHVALAVYDALQPKEDR